MENVAVPDLSDFDASSTGVEQFEAVGQREKFTTPVGGPDPEALATTAVKDTTRLGAEGLGDEVSVVTVGTTGLLITWATRFEVLEEKLVDPPS